MAIHDDLESGLALAVRTAGSQVAFAKLIGKRQSTVQSWLAADKPLPAEYVLQVERLLNLSRHDLRPDLYPREEAISPPRTHAQVPSAQPSAPAAQAPLPPAGVDGPSPAQSADPLHGVAA